MTETVTYLTRLQKGAERWFIQLALAIGLLSGALVAFGTRHGWFQIDDFPILNEAHDRGLSLDFLLSPVMNERFSPGHRVIQWIVLQAPGNEWLVVIVTSSLLVGVSSLLLAVLVRQITGEPLLALACGAVFGSWSGWTAISLWFGTAALTLPTIALMIAALIISVRWDRSRRKVDLFTAALLLLLACCFSVRAVILPPLLLILLVLATPSTRSITVADIWQRMKSVRALLIVAFLIPVPFVVLDAKATGTVSEATSPAAHDWLELSWHWILDGVGAVVLNAQPSVAGHPATTGAIGVVAEPGLSGQPATVWAVAGICLLVLLAASTIRGTRSATVWVAMLGLLLLCGLEIGYARLGQLGLMIVSPLRYHEADLLVIGVLAPAAWVASGKPFPRSGGARKLFTASAIVLAGLWLLSGARTVHSLHQADIGPRTRAAVEAMRETVPPIISGTTKASLIDTRSPTSLSFAGDRELPRTIKTFVTSAPFSLFDRSGIPFIVDNNGFAHQLAISRTQLRWNVSPFCLNTTRSSHFFGPGSAGTKVDLPATLPAGRRLVLTLKFAVSRAEGRMAIFFLPSRTGFSDAEIQADQVASGLRIIVPETATAISLSAWGGLRACLKSASLNVSTPVPQPAR